MLANHKNATLETDCFVPRNDEQETAPYQFMAFNYSHLSVEF